MTLKIFFILCIKNDLNFGTYAKKAYVWNIYSFEHVIVILPQGLRLLEGPRRGQDAVCAPCHFCHLFFRHPFLFASNAFSLCTFTTFCNLKST